MPLTTPQTAALQLGISAIPSVIQGVQGIRQNAQANRMLKNLHRPTLGVPTAETEALNVARNMASSFNLPNQFQAEQALNQQYAGGINNATNTASSSAEALAASVALGGNRMNAQNELAGQAANSYMLRNQNLQSILGDYAEWQQKAWDWNTGGKYLADAATASAMKQAGQTNMFNSVSNLAGMAANALPELVGNDEEGLKNGGGSFNKPIQSKGAGQLPQQVGGIITPSIPTSYTSTLPSTPNIGDFGYQVFGQGANMPTWNNTPNWNGAPTWSGQPITPLGVFGTEPSLAQAAYTRNRG